MIKAKNGTGALREKSVCTGIFSEFLHPAHGHIKMLSMGKPFCADTTLRFQIYP